MDIHELKIVLNYKIHVENMPQSFEYVKFNRDYKVGDIAILREYDHINKRYTGAFVKKRIAKVRLMQKDQWALLMLKD